MTTRIPLTRGSIGVWAACFDREAASSSPPQSSWLLEGRPPASVPGASRHTLGMTQAMQRRLWGTCLRTGSLLAKE